MLLECIDQLDEKLTRVFLFSDAEFRVNDVEQSGNNFEMRFSFQLRLIIIARELLENALSTFQWGDIALLAVFVRKEVLEDGTAMHQALNYGINGTCVPEVL